MATYEQGILGPFSGKVGTVVGANWRGKNVMRSRPKKTSHTPSEAQQMQREKFSTVTKFLNPIKLLLNLYFGQVANVRSRYNMATSYHIKEATLWTNDNCEIIYNKVMISKGDLQGVYNPTITPQANNELKIEWQDNSGQGMATSEDSLLVVVFSPDLDLFETFQNSATRQDTEATLTLSSYFQGLEVHCWVSFVSDTRKIASTSSYLGEIELL